MDCRRPAWSAPRAEHLGKIPIVALTANAFPEDVRACFAAGMDQFVAKPVNRETLVTALMTALFEQPVPDLDKFPTGSARTSVSANDGERATTTSAAEATRAE